MDYTTIYMHRFFLLFFIVLVFSSCIQGNKSTKEEVQNSNKIIGTWKLVYGEIRENDSIQVKNLESSEFIKIINSNHFAFFNQPKDSVEGFYGGAGSYTLEGDQYVEVLDYIQPLELRGHQFMFTVEFKGDSLIQYGLEEVKEANIKRYIVEKYIRIEH